MAKTTPIKDITSEEKIKEAARKVFTQKGYAATRTRDIAEEAGINLALLNYYFRSKEKLFDIIMMETMQQFIMVMKGVLNNEKTSLEEKLQIIVSNYIDLIIAQPDLPLFMLSEIRSNPDKLLTNMNIKEVLLKSHLIKQLGEATKDLGVHPFHFLMNVLSMTIFPFVGKPLIQKLGDFKEAQFIAMMQQRKVLIPKWIKAMLKTK